MTKQNYEAPRMTVIELEDVRANNGNHYGWKSGFVAPGQAKKEDPTYNPSSGHGNGKGN